MNNQHVIISLVGALIFASPATSYSAPCSEYGAIIKVENTKVGADEFVNFYVKSEAPDFEVTAVQGPKFAMVDGDPPLIVKGNKWTRIAFKGVNWTCEIAVSFKLPKPIIKQVSAIEQFEGYVTYVIGRQNKNYRGRTVSISAGISKISLKYR